MRPRADRTLTRASPRGTRMWSLDLPRCTRIKPFDARLTEWNTHMATSHYCPRCDALTRTPCRATWHADIKPFDAADAPDAMHADADTYWPDSRWDVAASLYGLVGDPAQGWSASRPAIRA